MKHGVLVRRTYDLVIFVEGYQNAERAGSFTDISDFLCLAYLALEIVSEVSVQNSAIGIFRIESLLKEEALGSQVKVLLKIILQQSEILLTLSG